MSTVRPAYEGRSTVRLLSGEEIFLIVEQVKSGTFIGPRGLVCPDVELAIAFSQDIITTHYWQEQYMPLVDAARRAITSGEATYGVIRPLTQALRKLKCA